MKFPDSPKEKSGQGASSPFGGPEARKQRDSMNGAAKTLVAGKGPKMVGADRMAKKLPVVNISGKLPC